MEDKEIKPLVKKEREKGNKIEVRSIRRSKSSHVLHGTDIDVKGGVH
jgi:hypothetical protein